MSYYSRILSKCFDKMIISDNIPNHAHAIYIPAYCLNQDCFNLSTLGKQATNVAIELMRQGKADYLIIASAYDEYWEIESMQKERLTLLAGIGPHQTIFAPNVKNSWDEVRITRELLLLLNLNINFKINSLIIVAEQYHMKRMVSTFQTILPDIQIYTKSFACEHFERLREPSLFKSIRSMFKTTWILSHLLALRYDKISHKIADYFI